MWPPPSRMPGSASALHPALVLQVSKRKMLFIFNLTFTCKPLEGFFPMTLGKCSFLNEPFGEASDAMRIKRECLAQLPSEMHTRPFPREER